jgi:hypothetical protein
MKDTLKTTLNKSGVIILNLRQQMHDLKRENAELKAELAKFTKPVFTGEKHYDVKNVSDPITPAQKLMITGLFKELELLHAEFNKVEISTKGEADNYIKSLLSVKLAAIKAAK